MGTSNIRNRIWKQNVYKKKGEGYMDIAKCINIKGRIGERQLPAERLPASLARTEGPKSGAGHSCWQMFHPMPVRLPAPADTILAAWTGHRDVIYNGVVMKQNKNDKMLLKHMELHADRNSGDTKQNRRSIQSRKKYRENPALFLAIN